MSRIITHPRIIILLVALVLSVIAISPSLDDDGVAIRNIARNSSAALAGISNPDPGSPPMSREIIRSVDGRTIESLADYDDAISNLQSNDEIVVRTNQRSYVLIVKPLLEHVELNETETVRVNSTYFDEELNQTINITETITRPIIQTNSIGVEDIGITVFSKPTNNIRKGLDLEGGTRVLLQPERAVTDEELDLVMSNIQERMNVYGVSDIIVRDAKDLGGTSFISVEIAGVNKDEVRELLARQGKFEAKIGEETVFLGGNDIAYVCRTPDCSGIDPQRGCGQGEGGDWFCSFRFQITLSPEAAKRQADATRTLDVSVSSGGESYLSENLTLYLDNQLVDQLLISSTLRGSEVTGISISGGGNGPTEREAIQNTIESMKRLQTIMITGSLPVELSIVKTDTISPAMGSAFLRNVMLISLLSILAVSVVVFIRYRKWKVSVAMVLTMISEVIILLGVASLIGWRLDLAGIAGIIIAVGTGVDDQIIIASETISKRKHQASWVEQLKRAFFIIMAAYFTTVVAMVPLWFAGAGLLRGFALTTILGVSIGVFITRPAFGVVMRKILKA